MKQRLLQRMISHGSTALLGGMTDLDVVCVSVHERERERERENDYDGNMHMSIMKQRTGWIEFCRAEIGQLRVLFAST